MYWDYQEEESPPTKTNPPKRESSKCRYCPVCKDYLGIQEPRMEVSLHCDECRAWFTYFPGVKKPVAKLDSEIPDACNCPSCQVRRGEID